MPSDFALNTHLNSISFWEAVFTCNWSYGNVSTFCLHSYRIFVRAKITSLSYLHLFLLRLRTLDYSTWKWILRSLMLYIWSDTHIMENQPVAGLLPCPETVRHITTRSPRMSFSTTSLVSVNPEDALLVNAPRQICVLFASKQNNI
jgi:hypothetical protein